MDYEQQIYSSFVKTSNIIEKMNTRTLLILIIIIAAITLIVSSINENLLDTNTFILTSIITIAIYIYMKREYSHRLHSLKLKNKALKKDSILDDICEDDTKNKELCKKYGDSKRNFYTISNLLLQQYDIKNKI
jgi:hypothetical protein